MPGKTYYEILNLPEGATKAQIKKSYRQLVKLYHPDVTDDPNAHEKYLEINPTILSGWNIDGFDVHR